MYYYHADGLGSITAITDQMRDIVQRYAYHSFGMARGNSEFENSYTYTGREWDKETGLYYYRARYYDPMEGRFISKDPIGFDGGDVNLYGYVQNNPTNLVDPEGTDPTTPGGDRSIPNPVTRCHVVTHNDCSENAKGGEIIATALVCEVVSLPLHAAKDGWHYFNLGKHSVGKTIIKRNLGSGYEAGSYLHINIDGKHFILQFEKNNSTIEILEILKVEGHYD